MLRNLIIQQLDNWARTDAAPGMHSALFAKEHQRWSQAYFTSAAGPRQHVSQVKYHDLDDKDLWSFFEVIMWRATKP